ncbi:MAG: ATP-binding protein [Chloroflexota bacterium]|nr:ATP-binding protein [Dehalococcoidia bacterium]MDW8253225.1 ATP-binding protein [Chloroflexota bacterium]
MRSESELGVFGEGAWETATWDERARALVGLIARQLAARVELYDARGERVASAGHAALSPATVIPLRGREGVIGQLQVERTAPLSAEQRALLDAAALAAAGVLIERETQARPDADAAEQILRTLLDLLAAGVIFVPRGDRPRIANRALARVCGDALPLLPTGRPSTAPSLLHAAAPYRQLTLGETPLRQALEEGRETRDLELILDPDHRILRVSAAPVRVGGEIVGALGVLVDITDEHDLRRVLLESLACGVLIHSADGALLAANQAAVRMAGVTTPDALAYHFAQYAERWQPLGKPPWDAVRGASLAASEATIECLTADGQPLMIDAFSRALVHPDGSLSQIVTTLIETTATRRALEALEQSEQRFLALFQHAAIGMAILDAAGTIVASNDRLCRFLARDHVAGTPFLSLIDQTVREQRVEEIEAVIAGRATTASGDLRFVSEPGIERWGHVTISRAQKRPHDPSFLLATVADISERKVAERQLTAIGQAEKLRALGQMASGVAHDLNQYLGLISGHGELALRALDEPTPDFTRFRESLGIIIQAALDGADVVRRLQAFARARPDTAPMAAIDLAELLREVAKLTAPRWRDASQQEGRPIDLYVETAGDTVIDGWAESLREAFTNLVFNAVDALPSGGTIRLVAERRENEVHVVVADDGIGMSAEVQSRIFEPFFTTKGERGSGLGLSIVYTTVERHGGRIAVDSAPGRGTAFHLVFPGARGEGAAPSPRHVAAPPQFLRVLAVDDDPALARMLALMLEKEGHDVLVAHSGEEALRLLEQGPADLVITDLGLGTGMNGWELAERLRQQFPHVRIALATGWGAEIDLRDAARAGICGVLAKPYRIADLRQLLATLTGSEERAASHEAPGRPQQVKSPPRASAVDGTSGGHPR